jgi:hypothetical protein
MHDHQLKPKSTLLEASNSNAKVSKGSSASTMAKMQARAGSRRVDDLSVVSQVLKAQYKRQQASTLQSAALEEEEEKQGKSENARLQVKLQSQHQGKESWQKRANPAEIFSGSGSPLSAGLMAKYERLMPGVSLAHVKVYQGASVDRSLAGAGLQGLTDGTRVAVSSKAQHGTLEHELGHVAQRQLPDFNLNESSRTGYEQDADNIAASLVASKPVNKFQGSAIKGLSQKIKPSVQAKCGCGGTEQEKYMNKILPGQNQYQSLEYQANPLSGAWEFISRFPNCLPQGLAVAGTGLAVAASCGMVAGEIVAGIQCILAAPFSGGVSLAGTAVIAALITVDGLKCAAAFMGFLGAAITLYNCLKVDPRAAEEDKRRAAETQREMIETLRRIEAAQQQQQQRQPAPPGRRRP